MLGARRPEQLDALVAELARKALNPLPFLGGLYGFRQTAEGMFRGARSS